MGTFKDKLTLRKVLSFRKRIQFKLNIVNRTLTMI